MSQVIDFRIYAGTAPQAIEAEQALLGLMLRDNSVFDQVNVFLREEHFEEPIHQRIWKICAEMISNQRVATPITVKAYLPQDFTVGEMTVMQYAMRLAVRAPHGVNPIDYGRSIVDNWAFRAVIDAAKQTTEAACNPTVDLSPQRLIAEHVGRLNEISDTLIDAGGTPTMEEAVDLAIKASTAAYRGDAVPGLSTGIEAIDRLTGPWEPGQQIVIGGGTKMGKTALALQTAVGLCAHGPVWIYSGEMSRTQLARREIARRTAIPLWKQREGKLTEADWEKIGATSLEVGQLPLFIEERRLTLEQIKAAARETQRQHGLVAIIIDHVGLVRWEGADARKDEWQQSQWVTQEMKAIAKELHVIAVSLVQLKKNVMTSMRSQTFKERLRQAVGHRPTYTDMMGAVERDADHVIIPLNVRPLIAALEPEKDSDDHQLWEDRMREHEHKAQLILALSREQEFPATQEVYWDGATTSFHPRKEQRPLL